MNKVFSLDSFWTITAEAVAAGKILTEKEREVNARKAEVKKKEDLKFSFNVINNQKDEIKELLDKAGIKASVYFPFKTSINAQGEMEFTPKNIFKMKKDSKKARKQLEEALEKNKITEEEFKQLSDSLTDMLKENGLDEKKEKEQEEKEEITVTEEEINELYATFNRGIEDYYIGLIASIGNNSFKIMCEEYENMDLEEKKELLGKINKGINKKMDTTSKLQFISDGKNFSFQSSVDIEKYSIHEKDVKSMDLRNIAKSIVEKAMVCKLRSNKNQNLTASQRQALYNKILQQKRMQEKTKEQVNSRQIKFAG